MFKLVNFSFRLFTPPLGDFQLAIAGFHGRGTPGISCLYVEELLAGSRPTDRDGTSCCATGSDSGVSSGVYLGVLGACYEEEIN